MLFGNFMTAISYENRIKVGRGKYMLRLCRICGDAETFATIAEVDLHIQANHPVRLFGNLADLEEEQVGYGRYIRYEQEDMQVVAHV